MTSNTLFCIIANGVNEMDIQTILIRNGQNKLLERMKKLNENERKELTAQRSEERRVGKECSEPC